MSNRQEIQLRIFDFLSEYGYMTSPIAGDLGQSSDRKGKPYFVTFGTSRYCDGSVYVYGDTFIQVQVSGAPFNNGRFIQNKVVRSEQEFYDWFNNTIKA